MWPNIRILVLFSFLTITHFIRYSLLMWAAERFTKGRRIKNENATQDTLRDKCKRSSKEKGEINKIDYQRVNYYHSALCKKVKNRTYNKRNFEQKFQ